MEIDGIVVDSNGFEDARHAGDTGHPRHSRDPIPARDTAAPAHAGYK